MSRQSKREVVLRAAEREFADKGYDRATMRGIAGAADVGLPLVVYHFETKLALYRSIFEEHQHWNEARRQALQKVDLTSPAALEEVVSAFLTVGDYDPDDDRRNDYLRLVLREASDPHAPERGITADFFDPMAKDFIAAFETLMPDKPADFHLWAYLFAVGAFTSTNVGERARALSTAPLRPRERLEYLHRFICAGLRNC